MNTVTTEKKDEITRPLVDRTVVYLKHGTKHYLRIKATDRWNARDIAYSKHNISLSSIQYIL